MEHDETAALGDLLRCHRERRGLTQEELAERVATGVSVETISNVERGRTRPQRHTVRELLGALELTEAEREEALGAWRTTSRPGSHKAEAAPVPPPAPLTPLVGRQREFAAVANLLQCEDVRLLTLTGPGGVGKTRLALEVAATLGDSFPQGVVFVDLTPLRDPRLVVPMIARTLGLRDAAGDQPLRKRLAARLRGQRLLMLLDNFEPVVAAAPGVTELLVASPGPSFLATSRIALRVRGEQQFEVLPLELPSTTGLTDPSLSQVGAVELFVQRAQSVAPSFALNVDNAAEVGEVCCRLDGLPLALELAASWIKVLPPRALLERMEHRLAVLVGGASDLPERHQTLRGTLAWSHDLLEERERALFRRLAVFVGGCTPEAVDAVCSMEDDCSDSTVLEELSSLVDKSLLGVKAGEPRFTMLETIQEYAQERLEESGEAQELRRRHAAFFLELAELAEPHLTSSERERWLDRMEAERDNLRAVLAWSTTTEGQTDLALRLAGTLIWFSFHRGYVSEARNWLERALSQRGASVHTVSRARALYGAAGAAWARGDYAMARAWLEESVAIFRGAGEHRRLALALTLLGMVLTNQGAAAAALAPLRESLSLSRKAHDLWGTAYTLHVLGDAKWLSGDPEPARRHYEESLALFEELGDQWGEAMNLGALGNMRWSEGDEAAAQSLLEEGEALFRQMGNKLVNLPRGLVPLGHVALARGDHQRAQHLFADSLSLWQELGNKTGILLSLAGVASVADARGRFEAAARLLGATFALFDFTLFDTSSMLLDAPASAFRAVFDRAVANTRANLDEERFAAAWVEGQGMTLEQAMVTGSEIASQQR